MNSHDDSIETRKKVLELLREGATNREIAAAAGVSERHVKRVKKAYLEGGGLTGVSAGYDYYHQHDMKMSSGCYHGNSEMMTEEQKMSGDPMYTLRMLETEMEIDEMGEK